MNEEKEFEQFSIRVPIELNALIQKDAANNMRSRTKQINFVLEEYYAEKPVEVLKNEETAHSQK